ncbi:MAG: phosphatase PAP2 family protein [Bacteroidales bacterium]|nr:phosphatase PAP2 family protein [Bacteroidales bacterium]
MIATLNEWDTWCFRWVNGHHCEAMDWLMWGVSQHWSWAVVLVLAFSLLTMRREPRRWWVVVVGVVLCFLLADQGSVQLFKNTVCRLRPCHALEGVRMFRTGCGGQYGFVSSHAANAFAIATLLWMRYRRWEGHSRGRALLGPGFLLLWAVATSYSRAYLGKHYPGDLLCGALFGVIIGLIIWQLMSWIEKKCLRSETK